MTIKGGHRRKDNYKNNELEHLRHEKLANIQNMFIYIYNIYIYMNKHVHTHLHEFMKLLQNISFALTVFLVGWS